eukprot:5727743-Lingulodinium_polyedra.AAC.1
MQLCPAILCEVRGSQGWQSVRPWVRVVPGHHVGIDSLQPRVLCGPQGRKAQEQGHQGAIADSTDPFAVHH